MDKKDIILGGSYIALRTELLRKHGDIAPESTWWADCTVGDKVSLSHRSGNGLGLTKITIAKAIFGLNFERDRQTAPNTTGQSEAHYYPDFKTSEFGICSFKGKSAI